MPWRAPQRYPAVLRLLMICLPLMLVPHIRAQDTGQVCVQSFEDRDADGLRDPDEGAVRHGVAAGLRNVDGVTIATRLLEDSLFAGDGLLCFDRLLAGEYQVILRSAEFTNTTAAAFPVSVNPGAAPALVEFGVQPLQAAVPNTSAGRIALDDAEVAAVLRGLVSGLIVIALISGVGLLILVAVYRRRSSPQKGPMRHGQSET